MIMVADAARAQPGKLTAMITDKSTDSRADTTETAEYILFDGTCALCHGFVTFVLKRDRGPKLFHFAPLQGEWVMRTLPEDLLRGLPDSIVVLDAQGRTQTESAAVIYVLRRLGGFWRLVAGIWWLAPRPLRDWEYRVIASIRKKIFGTKDDLCPIIPVEWRGRFEM